MLATVRNSSDLKVMELSPTSNPDYLVRAITKPGKHRTYSCREGAKQIGLRVQSLGSTSRVWEPSTAIAARLLSSCGLGFQAFRASGTMAV